MNKVQEKHKYYQNNMDEFYKQRKERAAKEAMKYFEIFYLKSNNLHMQIKVPMPEIYLEVFSKEGKEGKTEL